MRHDKLLFRITFRGLELFGRKHFKIICIRRGSIHAHCTNSSINRCYRIKKLNPVPYNCRDQLSIQTLDQIQITVNGVTTYLTTKSYLL